MVGRTYYLSPALVAHDMLPATLLAGADDLIEE